MTTETALSAEHLERIIEMLRTRLYPHHDAATFRRYLNDLAATGWDEVRAELELAEAAYHLGQSTKDQDARVRRENKPCRVCGGGGFVAQKQSIDDGYGEVDSCPACSPLSEGDPTP